jgi:virginiamycin B lyase
MIRYRMLGACLALALAGSAGAADDERAQVQDYPIAWPEPSGKAGSGDRPRHHGHGVHGTAGGHGGASGGAPPHGGSTHEIAFDPHGSELWISGQNYDALARVETRGRLAGRVRAFLPLPQGSGPHGLGFDRDGHLWVTLEYLGRVEKRDARSGRVLAAYDVALDCRSCPTPINSHPHGLGLGADGRTVWFTGKATGTIGRIAGGKVKTFALATPGSTPIYIHAGPDGSMWVTELTGNKIARVRPDGSSTEFAIPTPGSRPIAIVPGPDGAMWFSEEAGSKIGRIDLPCLAAEEKKAGGGDTGACIAEYEIPRDAPNRILAGLAFDDAGDLWVQQYVDQNSPVPGGADFIVRIAFGLARGEAPPPPSKLAAAAFSRFPLPTRGSVMHRIIQGPDGRMWFTEMGANKVGVIGD